MYESDFYVIGLRKCYVTWHTLIDIQTLYYAIIKLFEIIHYQKKW